MYVPTPCRDADHPSVYRFDPCPVTQDSGEARGTASPPPRHPGPLRAPPSRPAAAAPRGTWRGSRRLPAARGAGTRRPGRYRARCRPPPPSSRRPCRARYRRRCRPPSCRLGRPPKRAANQAASTAGALLSLVLPRGGTRRRP